MRVIPPRGLARDELAVAALPAMTGRGGESWNQRLNLYAGRDLTATALSIEQRHRERHLTRLGRSLSPGIVEGLEVLVEPGPPDRLIVGPGRGLLADGQDIVLAEARALPATALVTLDATTPLPEQAGDPLPPPPSGIGVLLLVPVLVTQEAMAAGDAEGAFAGPCPDDLSRIAFTDFRRYDAALLAFHPWPAGFPLHTGATRRRNLLAAEILAREAAAPAERAPLPWNAIGLALALVELDPAGKVTLLDRGAVARKGGASIPRRALQVPGRGTPFLWQARLQQLAAQLEDELGSGWDAREAGSRLRFLPPVGVVPRAVWDAGFFPPAWHRVMVPVPLQQLELAIAASAGLAPFDLEADLVDVVKWLVPVPEEVYEPELLQIAALDPAFDATVADLLAATSGTRARRDQLRALVQQAVTFIDKQGLAAFAPDQSAIPGEDEAALADPPLEPAERFARTRLTAPLIELRTALRASGRISADELARIDPDATDSPAYQGLGPFTADLQARLEEGDDRIDLGFTRLQAELYRVRQIVLDNEESTRLATSPVLAGIVREGVSAVATSEAIRTYFAARRGRPVEEEGLALRAAVAPIASAIPLPAARPVAGLGLDAIVREGRTDLAQALLDRTSRPERDVIRLKLPIPGEVRDFRTVTVADRLKLSAALEAKSSAVRLKSELLVSLRELGLPLDALPVPLTPPGLAVLPGPILQKLMLDPFNVDQRAIIEQVLAPRRTAIRGEGLADPESLFLLNALPLSREEAEVLRQRQLLGLFERNLALTAAAGRRSGLGDPDLVAAAIAGRLDPDPPNGDEAAFLSTAIGILEGTVAILRAVEGRIIELRGLLDRSEATLATLEAVLAEWRAALAESEKLLAEHRHDLMVARTLREEERERITAVNRRRQDIVDKEVRFVAFARPRVASPLSGRALPRRVLPGRLQDPVLPCLDAHGRPPPELDAMLGALRDVPLGWLAAAGPLLDRLGRPEDLDRLVVTAVARARQSATAPAPPIGLGTAVALAATWQGFAQRFQAARAELDPRLVVGTGWRTVRARALRDVSLDDLIESARRQPALVRAASEELERIEKVAVCLYERAGELPGTIRFAWVQQLSEFDAAADLSRLERLPRFGEVPAGLRRDLSRLVAWLFARLAPGEPEARALMSDIVRVALLLAGRAPVAELVRATLAQDFTGAVGDLVTVALPPARARVGMAVEFRTSAGPVGGVVQDLQADSATVRLTRAPAPRVTIPAATDIRLLTLERR